MRQAFEAGRMVTDDQALRERIVREVLSYLSSQSFDKSPPAVGRDIHRIIRHITGERDPYLRIKRESNSYALTLLPSLKKRVNEASDPFETSVRLAIAGNIIDCGQGDKIDEEDIKKSILYCLNEPIDRESVKSLKEHIAKASNIVYLGDNAGEIVFDTLLIEQLSQYPITFVVRGSPVINDALKEDAVQAGIDRLVKVTENGADIPGTIVEECSNEFQELFMDADLIIAKGQGNFETLSDTEKRAFFLLKAKCPVIAEHIGCSEGEMVVAQR